MKTIFRIAKTELRTLFYSPIAWFLLIVFLIQCSITYSDQLGNAARTQEIGGIGLEYMTQLTSRIFLSPQGLFSSVMQKLYLFIPLLTMGLVSRETSSGTIKLLYSSPVDVREIVFGKFLAMMIYSLLLVAVVSIFMIDGMAHIKNADGGMLLSGALGFYLLLCAYSAIGLFMSCLTTYQVVAAVATFIMIGILSYIGTLWQDIDFVRDLTYFLSLNGRAEKMLSGLITTKDVLYFVVIVYIFLGLSIYKLKSGMESKPALVNAGRYAAIVLSAVLIGYVGSLPKFTGYLDMTTNKSRTLTPNAQNIIKELGDEPLEVTTYNNMLGRFVWLGLPEGRNRDLARWEPYMRFKNNIKLNYVQYYDTPLDMSYLMKSYPGKSTKDVAEQVAKSSRYNMKLFKTPEEIRKIIDLRPELNRYVMQLKYKGRTTFLRVFDDQQMWPGETEVSAAFKRLLQAKLPKVVFLAGDLERSIDKMGDKDYKALTNLSTFRYSLVNQGFDVDTITLDTRDIPDDVSTLVVADPKMPLTPVVMAKLQQYIDKGGNLLVAGEPGRQSLLNPLLKPMGVQLMDGEVVQQSKEFSPDLVTPDLTNMVVSFSKRLEKSKTDSQKVSMSGTVGLSYTNGGAYTIEPLLMTNSKISWSKKNKLDLDLVNNADASTTTPDVTQPPGQTVKPHTNVMHGTVVHPGSIVMHGAAPGNMPPMSPEAKKRSDSVRAVFTAILNGPGTPDEKREKMKELGDALRKSAAARAQQNGTTVMKPQALVKKEKPAEKEEEKEFSVGGGGVTAVAVAGPVAMSSYGNAPSDRRRNPLAGTVTFSAADGDLRGPVATALSLSRKVNGKEQRIIVTGDADFMSNVELSRNNMRTANFLFNTALFSWLNNGSFPIDTSRPDDKDKRVSVSTDAVDRLKIIFLWVLPAILVAFATILLIRRKRK